MNDSNATQTNAEPAKAPATYTPAPAKDKDVTAVPTTPAKGNDEVMSTPAKKS
ncbi:MAG TPA: hypothetical protein VGA00_02095 [Acidiferrobacterales bacterium]|jgi:hypothetical protein